MEGTTPDRKNVIATPSSNGGSAASSATVRDPDAPTDYGLRPIDFVLAVLTFPLLMFVLMFATSGTASMLEQPAARLRLGLVLVMIEVAAIALAAWLVVRR